MKKLSGKVIGTHKPWLISDISWCFPCSGCKTQSRSWLPGRKMPSLSDLSRIVQCSQNNVGRDRTYFQPQNTQLNGCRFLKYPPHKLYLLTYNILIYNDLSVNVPLLLEKEGKPLKLGGIRCDPDPRTISINTANPDGLRYALLLISP